MMNEIFWYKNKAFTKLKLDYEGVTGWENGDFVYGNKDEPDTPSSPPDPGIPSDWSGIQENAPPPSPDFNNTSSGKQQSFVDKWKNSVKKISEAIDNVAKTVIETTDKVNPATILADKIWDKSKEGEQILDLISEEISSGNAKNIEEALQNLKDKGKIQERNRNVGDRILQSAADLATGRDEIYETSKPGLFVSADIEGRGSTGYDKRYFAWNYELAEGSTTDSKSAKEAQENRYKEEIERNKAQAAAQGKPAAEQNVQKKAEQVLASSTQQPTAEKKIEEALEKLEIDESLGEWTNNTNDTPKIPDTPPSDIFPKWAWPEPPGGGSSTTLNKNNTGNFSDIKWEDQTWSEYPNNTYKRNRYYIYDEWYYPKGFADKWTVFMAIEVRKQNEEIN